MTPRKPKAPAPKPEPLAEVIAASVRRFRQVRELTQGAVAQGMNEIGYPTWGRTTVVEIEGKGRGRGITLAELIGVAYVLGVTVFDLVIPTFIRRGDIEIAPGGLVADTVIDFMAMIIPPEIFKDLAVDVATKGIQKELARLRTVESNRLYHLASQLRDRAEEFESTADDLNAKSEEAPS